MRAFSVSLILRICFIESLLILMIKFCSYLSGYASAPTTPQSVGLSSSLAFAALLAGFTTGQLSPEICYLTVFPSEQQKDGSPTNESPHLKIPVSEPVSEPVAELMELAISDLDLVKEAI